MFIDSHCHLQLFAPHESVDQIIEEALQEQVIRLLCVSTNLEQYSRLQEIKNKYTQYIDLSIGVHPCEESFGLTYDSFLKVTADKDIVAIGEIGLDYYRNQVSVQEQQERFQIQLKVAAALKKPVILHTRSASVDTLKILQSYPMVRGVSHCFTESLAFAKSILDLGWYISFSGIITFSNADDLRRVVKFVPLDRILVETDSPYLAPVPFRGKTNYPKYVKIVTENIAKIHNIDINRMVERIRLNYNALFGNII